MKSSDVLACLSLAEQQEVEIHDRLSRRGHFVSMLVLRRTLNTLTESGLAVTRRDAQGGCFYCLAEGEAVEAALDTAWSPD